MSTTPIRLGDLNLGPKHPIHTVIYIVSKHGTAAYIAHVYDIHMSCRKYEAHSYMGARQSAIKHMKRLVGNKYIHTCVDPELLAVVGGEP